MSLFISRFYDQPILLDILIRFVLASIPSYAQAACYFPDGVTVAGGDFPCNTGGDSACCGDGFICLSNNMCMATGDEALKPGQSLYVRGSCTDRTWNSTNCPSFCLNPNPPNDDLISGGNGIAKCPNTKKDMYYCIDGNTNAVNCSSEENVLVFQVTPFPVTTIGIKAPSPKLSTLLTAATTAGSVQSSVTTVISSMTTISSSTSTVQPLSSAPLSPTTQVTPASSRDLALAAGLGASLGAVVIAVAVFFGLQRKRQLSATHPRLQYHDAGYGAGCNPSPPYEIMDGQRVNPIELANSVDASYELPALSAPRTYLGGR